MIYPLVEDVGVCIDCGEHMYYDHDTGRYINRSNSDHIHQLEREEEDEGEEVEESEPD